MGAACSKQAELRPVGGGAARGGGPEWEGETSTSGGGAAGGGGEGGALGPEAPGAARAGGGKGAGARKPPGGAPRARGEPPALQPPGAGGPGRRGGPGSAALGEGRRSPPSAGELLGWAPLLRAGAQPGAPRAAHALGAAPRAADAREALRAWPPQGPPGLVAELAAASGGCVELPSPAAAGPAGAAPPPAGPNFPGSPRSGGGAWGAAAPAEAAGPPRPLPPRAPPPGAAGAEVHVCYASGTAAWSCAGALAAARGGSSGEFRPKALVSAPFRLPGTGSRVLWRLGWVPAPALAPPPGSSGHLEAGAGLFLECLSPLGGGDAPLLVRFSLGLVSGAAPAARADLVHSFSRRAPVWGVPAEAFAPGLLPPGFTGALRSEGGGGSGGSDATPPLCVLLRAVLAAEVPNLLDLPEWLPSGGAPGGISLVAERVSTEPRVFVIDNFLTSDECAALRDLAAPDLVRSRVSSGTETNSRTSRGTFLTGAKEAAPVVLRLESRIAAAVAQPALRAPDVPGGPERAPLRRSEALQVVHYDVGQFYHEHYDNKAGNAAARAASFLVYLKDVPEGGATYFPRSTGRPAAAMGPLSRPAPGCPAGDPAAPPPPPAKPLGPPPGLRIFPREGRAIIFWSRTAAGHEDGASIHAAETVLGGEKWIITRWLREEA